MPPHQRPFGQAPLQHLQAQHAATYGSVTHEMDAEASDSDVSTTGNDMRRPPSPLGMPVKIPPPSSRLDSSDAVDNRLRELSRIDDRNVAKVERLRAKRKRMDDEIARKREAQDRKIKEIMDARQRRNERIAARRAREDAEFRRVDDQVEEEESSLRRRLKRLKRGLAPDESPLVGGSNMSNASASPPGPAYSTIPPPAKRHQSNPPGQTNSPRTTHHNPPPLQPPAPAPAPSYSFYQGGPKPYSAPYQPTSGYSTAPPPPAHAVQPTSTAPPPGPGPIDRPPFTVNGRPASPLARPPQVATPPASNLSTAPPPRQISSTYDTRPPPPASSSGFASVNAPPPSSGFATINARSAATPPANNSPIARSDQEPSKGLVQSTSYNSETGNKSSSANSTPVTGKRTPSTTHPYQMSEAFANRHHHCERVDDLNRGIWTSHGPGGTQEHPTGPPVQMYLRCNHDNCRRIDWRTVHGLQCHIVKSHEQPKGTIGSLEKALDRYGVPVKEVEDYEREHGEGTGGTMADPKNLKIKNKTREQAGFGGKKSTPGSFGIDPNARPAGYKPSPQASPTAMHSVPRYGGAAQSPAVYSSHGPPGEVKPSPSAPAWSSINTVPAGSAYGPPRPAVDPSKQLQGDAVMKNSTATPVAGVKASEPARPASRGGAYEFSPRPFEYQQRPPPVTPQVAKSPKAASKSGMWGIINSEPHGPPPYGPRWGVSVDKKIGTPVTNPSTPLYAEPKPLQDPEGDKAKDSDTVMKDAAPDKPVEGSVQAAPATRAQPAKEPEKAAEPEPKPAAAATADAMDVDSEPKKAEPAGPITAIGPEKPESEIKETVVTASGGPASGTRSAQSPLIANKPLSAPTSVKRMSRRSSMARKLSGDSGDGRMGVAQVQPPAAAPAAVTVEPDSVGDLVDGPNVEGKKVEKEKTSEMGEAVQGQASAAKEGNAAVDGDDDGDSITVTSKKQKDEKGELKESERVEPRTPPPRRAASGRFTRKRTGGF